MNRFSNTERVGVNAVEQIILKDLNWIFREQPIIDMGIDAHIESIENGKPTGKLIGVQIKSGESHFTEKDDQLVYYGKNIHLEYWLNHSLPVIIIGYLPEKNEAYWAHVTKSNIQKTTKNWKISIPKKQLLNSKSKDYFEEILKGSIEEIKFNNLLFHKGLMGALTNGKRLIVTLEEWVNKTLGRSPIKVIIVDEDGEESTEKEWDIMYVGYSIDEILSYYFPWADASVDYDFYADYHYDNSDPYDEPIQRFSGIYPYDTLSGEIAQYRIELCINDLGKSFLTVVDYMKS